MAEQIQVKCWIASGGLEHVRRATVAAMKALKRPQGPDRATAKEQCERARLILVDVQEMLAALETSATGPQTGDVLVIDITSPTGRRWMPSGAVAEEGA